MVGLDRANRNVIELNGVTVHYGEFQALDQVTARIPAGATGLVGRNGAGKSTLLRLLLGLVCPTTGTGRVLDVPLSASGRILRRAVGYMPESDSLLTGLRGLEQVALAGELCGLARREALRRAHEVLAYVGLGEARYRMAEEFSTGMRQRLKLAVALAPDPELLLLDEPTVGLDPPGRIRMLDLLRDLTTRHGKSLVISTHLLGDIERICETVVMIEAGRILAAGALEDILQGQSENYHLAWEGSSNLFLEAIEQAGGRVLPRSPAEAPQRTGAVETHADEAAAFDRSSGAALVTMPDGFDVRRFFHLAHQAGVCLRDLETERDDLSSLYRRLLASGASDGA